MTARERKVRGIRSISLGRNRALAARIMRAILRRKPGEAFTSESLRLRIRFRAHPNAWGAAIHNAARAGLIVRDGFQVATRPESHARILAVWRRA